MAERYRLFVWLFAVVVMLPLALSTPANVAQAAGSETFLDRFDAISYSGNSGSQAWSGSWVETGEADGPAAGKVKVVNEAMCSAGGCGYLTGTGNTVAGIQRVADLSGATTASLTFSYRRTPIGNNPAVARLSISNSGGTSWTTLAVYVLDAEDPAPVGQVFNVSSFVSNNTTVRFRIESTPGDGGRLHFDDVQISADFPDPTTTTTTTSPTTTSTTTTTLTTTTTSTTTPTSTTSVPTSSTSTTTTLEPPGQTTTLPPPSSTTSLPPPTTIGVTTTGPVALPPPEVPVSPFPIDLPQAQEPPILSPQLLATESSAVPDGEISSLVVVDIGESLDRPQTVAETGTRSGISIGGLGQFARYLAPGLALLALLAAGGLVSRRTWRFSDRGSHQRHTK